MTAAAMAQGYSAPPMRSGIFCRIDRATLDAAGWSFFDDLAGDLSAPDAIPMGGVMAHGMFGPHTTHLPREWEAHAQRLEKLRRCVQAAEDLGLGM